MKWLKDKKREVRMYRIVGNAFIWGWGWNFVSLVKSTEGNRSRIQMDDLGSWVVCVLLLMFYFGRQQLVLWNAGYCVKKINNYKKQVANKLRQFKKISLWLLFERRCIVSFSRINGNTFEVLIWNKFAWKPSGINWGWWVGRMGVAASGSSVLAYVVSQV